MAVPADFGAQLETHTGHGTVSVGFPLTTQGTLTRSNIRGTFGKGGGRLVMRSGNGNLFVRRDSRPRQGSVEASAGGRASRRVHVCAR